MKTYFILPVFTTNDTVWLALSREYDQWSQDMFPKRLGLVEFVLERFNGRLVLRTEEVMSQYTHIEFDNDDDYLLFLLKLE